MRGQIRGDQGHILSTKSIFAAWTDLPISASRTSFVPALRLTARSGRSTRTVRSDFMPCATGKTKRSFVTAWWHQK